MGWGQRWEGLIDDDERRRRGTRMSREAIESCRPHGARHVFGLYPGLTPWATFSSRLRRWVIRRWQCDRLDSNAEASLWQSLNYQITHFQIVYGANSSRASLRNEVATRGRLRSLR